MSFLITTAVIAGGSLAYGIGKGISQNKQASNIEKNNVRPTYQIPKEYQDNVNMARQMAQIGLPQEQYNNQVNNINRNQAGGFQTLSRSANPGAGVASVVRAGNDATNNLNAQDAAARQNNQRFFIGQNGVLGQQELAKQQYDKFDKYTEQFNKAAALRGSANQNIQNGINGASSMVGGLASLKANSNVSGYTAGQVNGTSDLPSAVSTYDNRRQPVTNTTLQPFGYNTAQQYIRPGTRPYQDPFGYQNFQFNPSGNY